MPNTQTPDWLAREWSMQQDRKDPLAGLRPEFVIPNGVIYLDGNSLGPMPQDAMARMARVVEREWGTDLIKSWNNAGWFDLPVKLGDKIARLIGANDGEVVVADSTSINLFKMLWAATAIRPDRKKIILEGSNFPTNNYMAQGLAEMSGGRIEVLLVEKDEIAAAVDEDTAAIAITHVHYKTGHVHDMGALSTLAQDKGALAVWDLCHSAGAMPVDLNGCNVDFAVGCTYKYLNGGPGSPAFLFVAERHQGAAQQPLTGWWGHAAPFGFDPHYAPKKNIRQFLTGTPPILSLSLAEVGIDVMAQVDMHAVRRKSEELTELFIRLVEQKCARYGFVLASPAEARDRGSQVSFRHAEGYAIMRALIDHGVIGDFRAPDIVRFGFAPLYVRFIDVWDAVEILADIMRRDLWRNPDYQIRDAVT